MNQKHFFPLPFAVKDDPTPTPAPTPVADPNKNGGLQAPEGWGDQQQKFMNDVVSKRLAREKDAFNAEIGKRDNEITTLRSQFEELNKKVNPTTDPTADPEKDPVRKQHKALLEEEQRKAAAANKKADDAQKALDAQIKQNKTMLKESAMRNAMSGLGFHSPEEVLLLTNGMIEETADGKGYVVKENGVTKENANLEPMTLSDFFKSWASQRPWSVNSDLIGGAGSQPNSGGNPGTIRSKADMKSPKEKSDYITKFGYDAWEKLPVR